MGWANSKKGRTTYPLYLGPHKKVGSCACVLGSLASECGNWHRLLAVLAHPSPPRSLPTLPLSSQAPWRVPQACSWGTWILGAVPWMVLSLLVGGGRVYKSISGTSPSPSQLRPDPLFLHSLLPPQL